MFSYFLQINLAIPVTHRFNYRYISCCVTQIHSRALQCTCNNLLDLSRDTTFIIGKSAASCVISAFQNIILGQSSWPDFPVAENAQAWVALSHTGPLEFLVIKLKVGGLAKVMHCAPRLFVGILPMPKCQQCCPPFISQTWILDQVGIHNTGEMLWTVLKVFFN